MIGLKRAGIWAAWFAAAFLAFGPSIGSRNGSGTFTTPNTFVAGTTITAAAFNQNFSDIASELTNSVAADGQTSMTGPLKLSNGTTGLPSMTFASDQDTGIYRSANDELSVSAGGTQIAAFSSAGIDAKVGRLLEGGQALVPPGVMFDYGGINAPTGYLLCDGSAVSRTTYVDLFNVIGTFYGSGNGSTTFNVPDFRGRVGAGRDDMGGSAANRITSTLTDHGTITGTSLGSTGGSETHAQSLAELKAHTHGVSGTTDDENQNHTHLYGSAAIGGPSGGGSLINAGTANTTSANNRGHTHTFSATTNPEGSSTVMSLLQPTIIVGKIIKY